jgi:hypothetical protein
MLARRYGPQLAHFAEHDDRRLRSLTATSHAPARDASIEAGLAL